jgi:predicted permease
MGFFSLGVLGYEPPQVQAFVAQLLDQVEDHPRVRSAALANLVPFGQGGFMGTFVTVDGYEPAPGEEMRIDQVFTTPGYFETLGIEAIAGRSLDSSDAEGAPLVAVVSRRMAEAYWPGGEAVGGILRLPGAADVEVRVVGVVDDVHWRGVEEEATNFVFLPFAQHPGRFDIMSMAVATEGDARSFLADLRTEAQRLDPELSFSLLTTLEDQVGDRLMPQRVGSVLLSGFAILALVLAAVGIVGVVSYTIREQRRAIGVRMALGAGRERIVAQVVRGMIPPVLLGLGAGFVGTLLLDDAAEAFLYGITPGDPPTYAAIGVGLAAVAILATLLPAREAARVDPMRVMRAE